jgi:glyoxylase-like metal-dependent hydrolase (beta-lactamase superfamily II)
MVRVEKIDSRITALILEDIRTCWLIRDKKNILIDSGVPSDARKIFSGLEKLSLRPKDVDFLALTHIHVDHAGSAGHLAKENTDLKIFVHEKGARHLINPVKLTASIKKAYGDKFTTVGELLKISSPDRVITVTTGDKIDLGNTQLEVYYTPGHAKHHVVYLDRTSDSIFSGDALGSLYPGAPNFVLSPPPDYDKELAKQSIDLIHNLCPKRIHFTHCGPYDLDGHPEFYDNLKVKHDLWTKRVMEIVQKYPNLNEAEKFEKFVEIVPELKNYPEQFWSFNLSLKGIMAYLERTGRI